MPFSDGWLVMPLIDASAASAMSTPASAARSTLPGIDAARVVRVEVNRHADFLAQRLDQRVRRVRLAQAGHVLDAEDVRAHLDEFASPS